MPLSDKTLDEMRAGAQAVAKASGSQHGLDPAYFEAMLRTQERHAWLTEQERRGRIWMEFETRVNYATEKIERKKVVHVGDATFSDTDAEAAGAWPSELMVAQIVLALDAHVDEKGSRDG